MIIVLPQMKLKSSSTCTCRFLKHTRIFVSSGELGWSFDIMLSRTCQINITFDVRMVNLTHISHKMITHVKWVVSKKNIVLPLRRLWYLVSRTLFAKGLKQMPRGLKVSRPLIANMILFVNISNFFKWKISTSWHSKQHIKMWYMVVLCFSMQGNDVFEGTHDKCHVFTFKDARGLHHGKSWSAIS